MTFPNGGQRDELHPNRQVDRVKFGESWKSRGFHYEDVSPGLQHVYEGGDSSNATGVYEMTSGRDGFGKYGANAAHFDLVDDTSPIKYLMNRRFSTQRRADIAVNAIAMRHADGRNLLTGKSEL